MLVIDIPSHLLEVGELSWISEETRRKIADSARLELYHSREIVFMGREKCPFFYVVISGNLEILDCQPKGEQLRSILYEGDAFGIPFFFGKTFNYEAMAVATTQTLLAVIPIEKMLETLYKNEDDAKRYQRFRDSFEAYHFIKNYTTFGNQLSVSGLVEFVNSFESKKYAPGDRIFDQGDQPDGYYICTKGLLKVIVEVDGQEVFSTQLKAGDHFGELAMINSAKRAGTVRAVKESECYFLSLETFNHLVKTEPSLMEGFQQLARLAY